MVKVNTTISLDADVKLGMKKLSMNMSKSANQYFKLLIDEQTNGNPDKVKINDRLDEIRASKNELSMEEIELNAKLEAIDQQEREEEERRDDETSRFVEGIKRSGLIHDMLDGRR